MDLQKKTTVDLSRFDNAAFDPRASFLRRATWYLVNAIIFNSYCLPTSSPKRAILRLFGASVGVGLVIKPKVNIKYPWNLILGDNVWLGERVWIDNLVDVRVGSNVCVSQNAFLLTGNHDYKDQAFSLRNAPIVIEDGAWIGASGVVGPGVSIGEHAVVCVGAILSSDADAYGVYSGNPATLVRRRTLRPD